MAEPFLSEVRIFSFGFAPQGWAQCNGQLLPINQNQALFSLLGTTYGGNGQTNFGLPELRGRVPMHVGRGLTLGQRGGEEAHTLSSNEMPIHTHKASASANGPTVTPPTGNFWQAIPVLLPMVRRRTQPCPHRQSVMQEEASHTKTGHPI